jgi:ankyrin repeat protein
VQVAAAMSGDSQAFSLAMQNGIDSADAQGNTALIAAAFAGNDALALQLIGAKADICKQNDTGCDATWVAAAYGKPDVLKTLLASGGSALSCNKQVTTAAACQSCFPAPCLVGVCCLSVRYSFSFTGG